MDLRTTESQMHPGLPPNSLCLGPQLQPHPARILPSLPAFLAPTHCLPGAPDSLQGQEGQLGLHFPSSQVHPVKQI